MPNYLVSVPFSLHVTVDAESQEAINDEMVDDALMEEHGKYAQIDVRHGGGDWEVLEEVE